MMRTKRVTGAEIRPLTVADLPSPDTKRWVIRRKAEVVAAVHTGLLSLEQACRRYSLDCEEFQSWERCIERFGVKGLRATRIQFYVNFGSAMVTDAWSIRLSPAELRLLPRLSVYLGDPD
jgi:hypothetical protein